MTSVSLTATWLLSISPHLATLALPANVSDDPTFIANGLLIFCKLQRSLTSFAWRIPRRLHVDLQPASIGRPVSSSAHPRQTILLPCNHLSAAHHNGSRTQSRPPFCSQQNAAWQVGAVLPLPTNEWPLHGDQ